MNRIIKRIAGEKQESNLYRNDKIKNEVLEFIVNSAKYDIDSDYDDTEQTGYVDVVITLPTSQLVSKFGELTSSDYNALSNTLKTDSYILESLKESAIDARSNGIESNWIKNPSDFEAKVNEKEISIHANYDVDGSKDEEEVNENDVNDYHDQKDFV